MCEYVSMNLSESVCVGGTETETNTNNGES